MIFEREGVGPGEAAQTVAFRDLLGVSGTAICFLHVFDGIPSPVRAQCLHRNSVSGSVCLLLQVRLRLPLSS